MTILEQKYRKCDFSGTTKIRPPQTSDLRSMGDHGAQGKIPGEKDTFSSFSFLSPILSPDQLRSDCEWGEGAMAPMVLGPVPLSNGPGP